MLERTFVHLPGIGLATERKFWDRGIQSWSELRAAAHSIFGQSKGQTIRDLLDHSEQCLRTGELAYFYENFPRTEAWRLLPGRLEDVAYLDIETNGLALPPHSQSTTITFYFRGQLYQEHEHHLKELLVRKMVDEGAIWCTYFGEVFDLPFLRREFNLPIRVPQLDLCYWLRRLGHNGGLKKVQMQFEDIPLRSSFDIGGLDAVRLWRFHLSGVPGALETLLAYNAEDTIVLEPLLVKAFNLEMDRRPELNVAKIDCKPFPSLPTTVHVEVYERLRATSSLSW